MKLKKTKVILIHPGLQYTYRIASALSESQLFDKVCLYTWFTLSENHFLSRFSIFKKRVKRIDSSVAIFNFPIFEWILLVCLKILSLFKIDRKHTPRYKTQVVFGYFLLPIIYFQRKNSCLVLSETAAWPLAYYAKKWDIPVLMDFPSISHESAIAAGINETSYGIRIKILERGYIDYALNCSMFAAGTYKGLTSAKKHYPLWLAADAQKKGSISFATDCLNICCLANTEKRKGIDLLIKAFDKLNNPTKKLYLIGKINKEWVKDFCEENQVDQQSIILTGPMAQQDLAGYLLAHKINLHVLASRFDSFGMVVPETMMLGIPNVVSPFVGAGEMLSHQVDGYIMKELDEASLINCVNDYVNLSIAEKVVLQKAVLKKAEQMTWAHYNERVGKVFKEILVDISAQ